MNILLECLAGGFVVLILPLIAARFCGMNDISDAKADAEKLLADANKAVEDRPRVRAAK